MPEPPTPSACCRGQALSLDQMQGFAADMNLSETAYVRPLPGDGTPTEGTDLDWTTASRFELRWFTPTTEVPLCGHGTLAVAAALFHHVGSCHDRLEFETLHSGVLVATKGDRSGQGAGEVTIDLPLNAPDLTVGPGEWDELIAALWPASPSSPPPPTVLSLALNASTRKLIVRIDAGPEELALIEPDFAALSAASDGSVVRGVVVTVAGGPGGEFDFSSRCFIPWVGIDEDPVNGSSHTVLAPFWASELEAAAGDDGRITFEAAVVSPRKGRMRVSMDTAGARVYLTAPAALVFTGTVQCDGW